MAEFDACFGQKAMSCASFLFVIRME
ncbi:hypothetical protein TcasGA2_TC000662 [Tribolium castaneum]|uniref:Uncharacterized protein n=1 Tax=Tribolium castaneum TaxID=7070 RepID=D6W904_TRICA|nr:hypothetical protein TcasGA2_TC000662 [Tribolium castaneum]